MIKKDYMKPTVKVVQLQHRKHLLIGSDVATSSDDPDYDPNSTSGTWEAN